MRRLRNLILGLALLPSIALATPAQQPIVTNSAGQHVDAQAVLCVDTTGAPITCGGIQASSVTGSTSAATITNSSALAVAAASRTLLAIDNESTTATIACRFGGTAAINTAGSFTIPPAVTRVWNSYPVPADAVNCISSAATSPATIEAY